MLTPQVFWNWFATAERRFRNIEVREKEDVLDELLTHLHEYSDGLYFEVGGRPGEANELVITADGNPDYFAEVEALVAAAPVIPGWVVTAFRPAMGFKFSTRYEDVTIAPGDCWFLPLSSRTNPELVGLRVAVPAFDESKYETFEAAVWIVVDTGLGEVRAARIIRHIEVCELPVDPEDEGFIELVELGDYLDWRSRHLDS